MHVLICLLPCFDLWLLLCVTFKYFIFVVADTNIMAHVKRRLDIDTSDQTKIQKKARSKIARKRNENTTLLENLATEAISSSQAEVEFCQKEYEERQVVGEEDEKQEEKINEVNEEEQEFMKSSMLVVMMGLISSMYTLSMCISSLMLMVKTLLGQSWEDLSSNSGISSREINWNLFFKSSCFWSFS